MKDWSDIDIEYTIAALDIYVRIRRASMAFLI